METYFLFYHEYLRQNKNKHEQDIFTRKATKKTVF